MNQKKCVDVIIEKLPMKAPGAIILDDCPSDYGMKDKKSEKGVCDEKCLECWKAKAEELGK